MTALLLWLVAVLAGPSRAAEIPRLDPPALSVDGGVSAASVSGRPDFIEPQNFQTAVEAVAPLPVSPALAAGVSADGASASAQASPEAAAASAPAQAAREEPKSIEAASAEAATRFDRSPAPARTGAADPAEALVEAYQVGAVVASPKTQALLERSADRAVRARLAQGNFKVYLMIGGILGTRMYEAPELPGVLLKTYAAPLGWKGKAWRGYNLAKARLGGLFTEITIVENLEVTINGKRKTLPWALVQEKVRVQGIDDFGKRSGQVLLGMSRRGVRDDDRRRTWMDSMDVHRNFGEAPDGRFVHLDADMFVEGKEAAESPKRVRDPPVLREAIRAEQLAALKPQDLPQWSFLDHGTLTAPEKEALVDFAGKMIAAAPAETRVAIGTQIRRVLAIGQRAGYDDKPGVAKLAAQIGKGGKLGLNKPFYLAGSADFKEGVLKIEVDALNFEPLPWWNKQELPVGRDKTRGSASSAYAQALYAVIKGAALRAAADPSIKRVEVGGWKVMNKDVAVELQSLGFARVVDPRVAGTAWEDRFPSSWTLRVPVRP